MNMKKIKNKMTALVCGIGLLCGISATAITTGTLIFVPFSGCAVYSIKNTCGDSASGTLCGTESNIRLKYNALFNLMLCIEI